MPKLKAPRFWWRRHAALGWALAPVGFVWGRIARRRLCESGERVDVPVICVGNFVAGGGGKTPTALALADLCRECGIVPGFLTRGYKGVEEGPVLVTRGAHDATSVGDEAMLLSRSALTVVAADRRLGAKLLSELGVGVIIMDDGFQNPSVEKDLSIVVVDTARGIGNGHVMPAGPLRAPLDDQIRRADAILLIGSGEARRIVRAASRAGLPVLRAHFEPLSVRGFSKKRYLAFAGIASPVKFYDTLAAGGVKVEGQMDFPDHHAFTEADCEAVLTRARARRLVPVTTEKDYARLTGRGGAAGQLAKATQVFRVRIVFQEPRRILSLVHGAVAGRSHGAMRRLDAQRRRESSNSRSRDAAAST